VALAVVREPGVLAPVEVANMVDVRSNRRCDRSDLPEAHVLPPGQGEPAVDLIERNELHGRIQAVGLSGMRLKPAAYR
jgi:hypothetical protein